MGKGPNLRKAQVETLKRSLIAHSPSNNVFILW